MGKSRNNDPRLIKLRFGSRCNECGIQLGRGVNAYYWSSGREVLCQSCGHDDFQAFLSSACDKDVYNSVGNPYCG
ncbi:MAG TPA: hypothetical protein VLH61_02625 [Bacteroidales bacterium]|nr:hypothetical protein [Bacteroidales bacterium]